MHTSIFGRQKWHYIYTETSKAPLQTGMHPTRLARPAYARVAETSGEGRVALFSRDRWGVGSVLTIGGLVALGSASLYEWSVRHSLAAAALGSVLYFGAGVLFVVKASEEIQRVRRGRAGPVGQQGVVVREIRPDADGVVKVGGELWTATSTSRIEAGARVSVVAAHGLRLHVERAGED